MGITLPLEPTTSALTEGSWIQFTGTAEAQGNIFLLRPAEEESMTLELLADDVLQEGGLVMVRVGAFILNFDVLKDSTSIMAHITSQAQNECDNNPTACIGSSEICCHSGKFIGKCVGYWRCPR